MKTTRRPLQLGIKITRDFRCPIKTSLDLFKRATWPGGSVAFVTLCGEQALVRLAFLVLVVSRPRLLTTVQNPSASLSLPRHRHELTRRSLCFQPLVKQITISSIHRTMALIRACSTSNSKGSTSCCLTACFCSASCRFFLKRGSPIFPNVSFLCPTCHEGRPKHVPSFSQPT